MTTPWKTPRSNATPSPNGYETDNKLDDSHFDEMAKFQGAELLDAYVFGDFDLADHPLQRVGLDVAEEGHFLGSREVELQLARGLALRDVDRLAAEQRRGVDRVAGSISSPWLG